MLASTLAFTSCSSDDDEEYSGAPNPANSLITNVNGDKLRLTSDGIFDFNYNPEGLPVSYETHYGNYNISYNPQVITVPDGDATISYSLNGVGYFSSAHIEMEWQDYKYGESYKGSGDMFFSYDGDGHLVKVTQSASGYYVEDGAKYSTSETGVIELTWADGKLMKASVIYNSNDGGEISAETQSYTFEYSNAHSNPLAQFSHSMVDAYCMFGDESELFAFFGFYGKPSNAFPTKVTMSFTDTDTGGNVRTYTHYPSYSFNSDGTLSSERYLGTYNYRYSNSASVSKSKAIKSPYLKEQNSTKRHRLFRLHKAQ